MSTGEQRPLTCFKRGLAFALFLRSIRMFSGSMASDVLKHVVTLGAIVCAMVFLCMGLEFGYATER